MATYWVLRKIGQRVLAEASNWEENSQVNQNCYTNVVGQARKQIFLRLSVDLAWFHGCLCTTILCFKQNIVDENDIFEIPIGAPNEY